MANGRWVALGILGLTAIFAAALWYFQTRAFYTPIGVNDAALEVTQASGDRVALQVTDFDGIDADSSPLRFRGCFTVTDMAPLADALPYPGAAPLIAPAWFNCFNATRIGRAIEAGEVTAYLGAKDFVYGVDRIIAVAPDGTGYAWPQMNACGEAAYSSDPLPPDCPPAPESN